MEKLNSPFKVKTLVLSITGKPFSKQQHMSVPSTEQNGLFSCESWAIVASKERWSHHKPGRLAPPVTKMDKKMRWERGRDRLQKMEVMLLWLMPEMTQSCRNQAAFSYLAFRSYQDDFPLQFCVHVSRRVQYSAVCVIVFMIKLISPVFSRQCPAVRRRNVSLHSSEKSIRWKTQKTTHSCCRLELMQLSKQIGFHIYLSAQKTMSYTALVKQDLCAVH